jgi:GNAT superfamily N-acetyltransferase
MRVEPLDGRAHDRASFESGAPSVDRYLRTVARQSAERFVAQTYVLVPRHPRRVPCTVMGFYTLVPFVYRDREMAPAVAQRLRLRSLTVVPTVLVAQFGISRAHQGSGLGAMLLRNALRRALMVGLMGGGAAVVTDPIDSSADAFYRRFGFLPFSDGRLGIPLSELASRNPDVVEAFHRGRADGVSFAPSERSA